MAKRMTKVAKAIDKAVEAAYYRHAQYVQVSVMDISKIMQAGRDALRDGTDLDEAMIAAVATYRQN